MRAPVRFLFTSVGRRVELMRHFLDFQRQHPGALEVFGTEIEASTPAAQLLDASIRIVPRVDDPSYVSAIRDLCRAESIDAIFPLIDPDISILGQHEELPLASVDAHSVAMVSDKKLTAEWLADNNVPSPQTWLPEKTKDHQLPAFMKPRRGSGGVDAFTIRDRREHDFFWNYIDQPIVQELLPGPEVTVDVIVGRDRTTLATVQRQRLAIRGGEVARAVVVDDPDVSNIVERVISVLQPKGPVTVQGMYSSGGIFRVTEINARMGGGLPLAIAAGVPLAELLTKSWAGESAGPIDAIDVGLHMARFDDSFFYRN